MKFNNQTLQKRYDKKVAKRLPMEFQQLVIYCKSRSIPISKEFKGNGAIDEFSKLAISLGYRLGMTARLISKDVGLVRHNLKFVLRSKYSKVAGDRKFRSEKGMSDIKSLWHTEGFGVELDLYGWYYFIDRTNKITLPKLYEKLKNGVSIEQILSLRKRHYLVFNGVSMPQEEACKKSGIVFRTFLRHVRKSSNPDDDQIRQKIFDELLKTKGSFTHYRNNWWIRISEDDKEIILQQSAAKNKSPSEWLHKLLQSYSYQ